MLFDSITRRLAIRLISVEIFYLQLRAARQEPITWVEPRVAKGACSSSPGERFGNWSTRRVPWKGKKKIGALLRFRVGRTRRPARLPPLLSMRSHFVRLPSYLRAIRFLDALRCLHKRLAITLIRLLYEKRRRFLVRRTRPPSHNLWCLNNERNRLLAKRYYSRQIEREARVTGINNNGRVFLFICESLSGGGGGEGPHRFFSSAQLPFRSVGHEKRRSVKQLPRDRTLGHIRSPLPVHAHTHSSLQTWNNPNRLMLFISFPSDTHSFYSPPPPQDLRKRTTFSFFRRTLNS